MDILILTATLMLLVLPASAWVQRCLALPTGDGAYHLLNTLTLQEQLLRSQGPGAALQAILVWSDPQAYPPLGYLVPAALGALVGGLDQAGLASLQILWVALTCVAVYVLARLLFGGTAARPQSGQGRRVALLAAFLVAFEPVMVAYTPDFLLEVPTTAMLLVALAALACSADMERTGPACVAGAAVGALLLTKWTALFYLPPALLYVFARVVRALPRQERTRTLQFLGGLALVLGVAAILALEFPAARRPVVAWLDLRPVLALLAGLGTGLGALAWYATRRLAPGPGRNLVLAALVASYLASPFYLCHAREGLRNFDQQVARVTPMALEYSEDPARQPSMLGETIGFPATLLVAAALVWLAAAGPRGGFALVGAPLLAVLAVRMVATNVLWAQIDFRYILPGLPLEILSVVGWLQSSRLTRAVSAGLLLSLGLWNAEVWLGGRSLPSLPGHHGQAREAHPDTLAPLVDALAQATGPGSHAVWVVAPRQDRFQYAVQTISLLRGHPLVLRACRTDPRDPPSQPAWTPVTRLVTMLDPRCTSKQLEAMSMGEIDAVTRTWVLKIGPAGWQAPTPLVPGRPGPPQRLPAPSGLEVRLQQFSPSGSAGAGDGRPQHTLVPAPGGTTAEPGRRADRQR